MIINLTQHKATDSQIAAGVVELSPADRVQIGVELIFLVAPTRAQVLGKAESIASIAARYPGATQAMIGGAPYLMAPLVTALRDIGIEALFSFTQRVSEDVRQPDGSVVKVATFKHEGWVQA